MTIEQLHQRYLQCAGAFTDSRNVLQNGLFFALKGAHFNGNAFASEALQKGALYAVVDEPEYATEQNIFLVDDVLQSLQQLATYHRDISSAKIIALTGSNGKTTTKELIQAVLAKKYRTVATSGNLNNHIGVPLTLLRIREDTELAIVEMGANHQGEIKFLSSLAKPDFGYITNFGKAHLEGFGGVQGVIKGKSELYDDLKSREGHIFYNADDEIQSDRLGNYSIKSGFSTSEGDHMIIKFLGASPFVQLEVNGLTIGTRLAGSYNFTNCAAAALIGRHFEVAIPKIKEAIESYLPVNNRSQLVEKSGYHILLDAYNANPSSMKAALDHFGAMESPRKTVFLGDMFELGSSAAWEHQQIADLAAAKKFDEVYLIGENFSRVNTNLPTFGSYTQFEKYIRNHRPAPGSILIKGSRGMALERILEAL